MVRAEASIVQKIRRFAARPNKVSVSRTAKFDMMAWDLTKNEVCEKIVEWIDAGEQIKETVLHSYGQMVGQKAYELKPRMCETLFYIKLAFCTLEGTKEEMLLISVHPDH